MSLPSLDNFKIEFHNQGGAMDIIQDGKEGEKSIFILLTSNRNFSICDKQRPQSSAVLEVPGTWLLMYTGTFIWHYCIAGVTSENIIDTQNCLKTTAVASPLPGVAQLLAHSV